MNRIINAAKLDFYAGKSGLVTSSFLLIVAFAVGALSNISTFTCFLTMVFAVTACGAVFSAHEKSSSEKLYGILPIKKFEIILGRYLYAFIVGIVFAAVASLLSLLIPHIPHLAKIAAVPLTFTTYWGTIMLAFIYFCFAIGISFPIYFRFSFAKAYTFTMLPMYLVVILAVLLSRKTNFFVGLSHFMQFFTDHTYLIFIFGTLASLILIIISAIIANLIYKKKEI